MMILLFRWGYRLAHSGKVVGQRLIMRATMIELSENIAFPQFKDFVQIAMFVLIHQLSVKHFYPLWQDVE